MTVIFRLLLIGSNSLKSLSIRLYNLYTYGIVKKKHKYIKKPNAKYRNTYPKSNKNNKLHDRLTITEKEDKTKFSQVHSRRTTFQDSRLSSWPAREATREDL